jgi:hypothetical protein
MLQMLMINKRKIKSDLVTHCYTKSSYDQKVKQRNTYPGAKGCFHYCKVDASGMAAGMIGIILAVNLSFFDRDQLLLFHILYGADDGLYS